MNLTNGGFTMGKLYEGNVSIYANNETKKINIKANPNGTYNRDNVGDLLAKMQEHANKLKFTLHTFVPAEYKGKTSGLVPVLLANMRFGGKPYLAMLPEKKLSTPVNKKSNIVDLA
tara:strand:- start:1275 stop:1622 length:348 start_codon:yes stop_codon:yes gene_type:complete